MQTTYEQYIKYLYLEEDIKSFKITKSQIDNAILKYKNRMKEIELKLKEHRIDVQYLKREAEDAAKIIKAGFKSRKDPKLLATKLIDKTKVVFKKIADDIGIPGKIGLSLIMFMILFYVNTFVHSAALVLGGPLIGFLFTVLICGPLVEELAKRISVKMGFPFLYTTIFAGLEALYYIVMLGMNGVPLVPVIVSRTLAFIMHMITTSVQVGFEKQAEETKDKYYSAIGYIAAVLIHFFWNLAAVIPIILSNLH